MFRRLGTTVLGLVAAANLIVFGLFAGVEPLDARMFYDCHGTCCRCMAPSPDLDPICADLSPGCEEVDCRWDEDCDPF